jgi:hypothetical protein
VTLSPCYAMTPKYRTEAHRIVNVRSRVMSASEPPAAQPAGRVIAGLMNLG